MGIDITYYLAAHLVLTDIYETTEVEENICPNHKQVIDTAFCPKCGQAAQKRMNPVKKKKYENCYENGMLNTAESHPIDNAIVLISNNKIGVFCKFEEREDPYKTFPKDFNPSVYMDELTKKYLTYIEWLKNEKKFKVEVRFGLLCRAC